MEKIIKVKELKKIYGKTTAVDGISFEVQRGEIFGMLGPNGAGKTTTVECLEGLRKPDGGSIRVLGVDPQKERQMIRERTGIQLQQSILPARMKVWEALDLYASFYKTSVDWRELMEQLGLAAKQNTPFAKLSGGQKQRLFVALALLPDPDLVFLDELTTGLDPQARRNTWDLIREVQQRGKTVFLTTHFMEEAEYLCDRVAILDQGRIVALDTPGALIEGLQTGERITFQVTAKLPEAFIKRLPEGTHLEQDDLQVVITGSENSAGSLVSAVVQLLTEMQIPFHSLQSEQANLEDVFLKLTGSEMRA